MTKLCRVHDLVRDLSLREAKKQRFYYVYSEHNPSSSYRRIVVPDKIWDNDGIDLESSPHSRSYVCHDCRISSSSDFRLLRTLHTPYRAYRTLLNVRYVQKDVFGLVNSRLLAITLEQESGKNAIHSSIGRLWSLQKLLVYCLYELTGPVEFWNMHQLKHAEFTCGGLRLELPPPNSIVILENLHTLIGMVDFHLNEDVVRRMPNLTILDLCYGKKVKLEAHCFSYLRCFTKLESFKCFITKGSRENLEWICFPQSLKQIILIDLYTPLHIELEDVLQKIGRLPFVEELYIRGGFFREGEWETIEGQFTNLKLLTLYECVGLKQWTVSKASHFPLLQELRLHSLAELEEIPPEIGEIATLESIQVYFCSTLAVVSAKKIVEEQEDLYGEDGLSFRVRVLDFYDKAIESSWQVPTFK